MKNEDKKKAETGIHPESISRFRKERFLRSMTEDQFRDQVIRPLFLRKGLKDGRDLCGIDEEGKDCIFVGQEQLGYKVIYAVQTKKGNSRTKYRRVQRGRGEIWQCPKHPKECSTEKVIPGDVS